MKTRIKLRIALLAFLTSATLLQTAYAGAGAYGSSTVAPTIYSKNFWYGSAYPVVGAPPSTAVVTIAYYNWSYPYPRPAGLQVYLCNLAGTVCGDVTFVGSGGVDFTGYGVPANQPLKLFARVNGTGTMAPLYGSSTSVTVNYTF
jgi:Flagellar protein FlhE